MMDTLIGKCCKSTVMALSMHLCAQAPVPTLNVLIAFHLGDPDGLKYSRCMCHNGILKPKYQAPFFVFSRNIVIFKSLVLHSLRLSARD